VDIYVIYFAVEMIPNVSMDKINFNVISIQTFVVYLGLYL